ncbi:MAG: hypothetical protein HIU88_05710 [Acidobacteria bacterium]|nr:hypothetical protein [Acidobacteriota bacterium]
MTVGADDKWIDALIIELRLRHVPGPHIGDTIASVRELLADSGQSAENAFGSAREYATSLEFSTASTRGQALSGIWRPILGLIAFLAFLPASTAWFQHRPMLFSAAESAFLALPVLLALTLPLYIGAAIRHRWLFVPLVLVSGAAGALSGKVAPTSAADAWLVTSPLPWLAGTAIVMLALSIHGTVLSVRSREVDEIVEPLPGTGGPRPRRGWHPALLVVNWLFPILAALVFALSLTSIR